LVRIAAIAASSSAQSSHFDPLRVLLERRLPADWSLPGHCPAHEASCFGGRSCELARLGYSRDQKRGSPQIVYGLLCDKPGRPIAVEMFGGELHDDKTLPSQISKLKARFGLARVVLVSDRGMVTKANLELLRETGAGWITALKAPQVNQLVKDGELQLSLFDQQNLAEITAEDYPDERLVVCRNPLVAADRARKREELLSATERHPHLPAQGRTDRTGSGAGRDLRTQGQRRRERTHGRRDRSLLQTAQARRARVPHVQRPRARDTPDPPPTRRPRPRARVPVHALHYLTWHLRQA
jgi:hypothetical protein